MLDLMIEERREKKKVRDMKGKRVRKNTKEGNKRNGERKMVKKKREET